MQDNNTNEKEEQATTLDLTGLKHNDEDLMMREAIDKVNQASNLKQLEEIDSLTTNQNQDENIDNSKPEQEVIKEKTVEKKSKTDKPKNIVHKEKKLTQIKKKKTNPLKEEDIVLEMSGGIFKPKKTKKIHNFKLPSFKISKKILITLIIITISIGIGITVYMYGIPVLKNVIEKINQNKEIQVTPEEQLTPITIEENKPTIQEAANNDDLNKQLEIKSYSSILSDLKIEIENYPMENINDELELLIIESTSSSE